MKKKPMSLTSCHEHLCPMKYVELNQTKSKKPLPLNERVIYKPVMDKTLYPKIEPQVQLGSMEGECFNLFASVNELRNISREYIICFF